MVHNLNVYKVNQRVVKVQIPANFWFWCGMQRISGYFMRQVITFKYIDFHHPLKQFEIIILRLAHFMISCKKQDSHYS